MGWGAQLSSPEQPVWPTGVIGSIAHCGDCGIAVVGRDEAVSAVGVDLVERNDRPLRVLPRIGNANERMLIGSNGDPVLAAAFLFGIKESLFKALFPLCNRFIGFNEAEVRIESTVTIILAESLTSDLPPGLSVEPFIAYDDQFVTTVVLGRII